MIRIVAITLALSMSVLLAALVQWFQTEELNVENINTEHLHEIKRLQKISKINKWLDKVVAPSLAALPKNEERSDDSLVKFYDLHADAFHFKITKYIYNDPNTHNLNISFKVRRDEKNNLENLMKLKYPNGFLQFNSLKLKDDTVIGELQLVQPFYGEQNASQR